MKGGVRDGVQDNQETQTHTQPKRTRVPKGLSCAGAPDRPALRQTADSKTGTLPFPHTHARAWPACAGRAWSHCAAVDRRCATQSAVRPFCSACSDAMIERSVRLSSALVASSSSSTRGACAASHSLHTERTSWGRP